MYRCENKKANIDEYYSLYLETGWNEIQKLNKEEVQIALDNSFICVSVYEGDTLVGVGRVNSDGVVYACIYDVIVKKSHHKKGIGSMIVNMLVEKCKEVNMRSIHLFTAEGVKEFYEKLGFEVRPESAPGMRYIGKEE